MTINHFSKSKKLLQMVGQMDVAYFERVLVSCILCFWVPWPRVPWFRVPWFRVPCSWFSASRFQVSMFRASGFQFSICSRLPGIRFPSSRVPGSSCSRTKINSVRLKTTRVRHSGLSPMGAPHSSLANVVVLLYIFFCRLHKYQHRLVQLVLCWHRLSRWSFPLLTRYEKKTCTLCARVFSGLFGILLMYFGYSYLHFRLCTCFRVLPSG